MKRFFREAITKSVLPLMCIGCTFGLAACSDDDNTDNTSTSNPAIYIKDANKLKMLRSMKNVDGNGRLYEIDYTEDYQLDKVLSAGYTSTTQLFSYISYLLFDSIPSKQAKVELGTGCSAFAVPEAQSGNYIIGRNYDYRHSNAEGTSYTPIAAILVRTAPKDGKKSISMVDALNLGYAKGFYTDGTTDLSLMMGLPYAALDGINEDGFAIGVLSKQINRQANLE